MEFKIRNYIYANAIRRYINKIPTLAIEEVYFYENTSVAPDEYIAHRLGLIPIYVEGFDVDKNERATFLLDVEGPARVLSGDLETFDQGVEIANKEIPIIELAEGQKLRIECVAMVGTAEEHVKWLPAHAYYRENASIKVKDPKKVEPLLEKCPKKVFVKEKNGVKVYPERCNLCMLCKNYKDAVDFSIKESVSLFIEPYCEKVDAKEIFKKSISLLIERLNKIKECLG